MIHAAKTRGVDASDSRQYAAIIALDHDAHMVKPILEQDSPFVSEPGRVYGDHSDRRVSTALSPYIASALQ